MKRVLWLIAVAALCLAALVGCAPGDPAQTENPVKPTSKFPNEPPILSVSGGEATVYAWRGTCSWDVRKSDGTGTGVQMDSPHPLDCVGDMAALPASEKTTITLTFEAPPSEIVVRRYKSSAKDYDAYEEMEVKGSSFEAKAGNYLYEVIATWDESLLRSYSGTAYYGFCTAK